MNSRKKSSHVDRSVTVGHRRAKKGPTAGCSGVQEAVIYSLAVRAQREPREWGDRARSVGASPRAEVEPRPPAHHPPSPWLVTATSYLPSDG